MKNIIDLHINEKIHSNKKDKITVLKDFKLQINEGDKIAIVGESGSGKTSLLNILGLLDLKYDGYYKLFDNMAKDMSLNELANTRNKEIGFVLQESALINSLTIKENIKLPLLYTKEDNSSKLEHYNKTISYLGIKDILNKNPLECSGGEKTRAIFARAILMNPKIVLCDEPTSSLDEKNKEFLLEVLFKLNEEFNTTIITVTHDMDIAKRHDKVIRIEK